MKTRLLFWSTLFIQLKLSFKNSEFDYCVSFQVLGHHENPQMLISEMIRVTRKGGYLKVSAPLIGCIHEIPNDFQRLTPYKIAKILKENGAKLICFKKEGSQLVFC